MKSLTQFLLLIGGVWVFAEASAHDPSLHTEKSEKADCAAFEKMDHSKMDSKDPVMQAMMKKCKAALEHGDAETDADHAGHQGEHNHPSESSASGHAH